jgi:hypothetical protein
MRVGRNNTLSSALKAGVTDHMWTMEELVELIDRHEAATKAAETST